MDSGLDRSDAEALLVRSVTVARHVRDHLSVDGRTRWVAASVGPYGAVLADGSEYRGRYGLSDAKLREFHLPRLEALASAGPDFMAVETIPDIDEAAVLVELLDELDVPAWFSFSSRGFLTGAGQPLSEAFTVAAAARRVFAVGVNCCRPSEVVDAVRLAAEVTGKPVVAYPNSGERWNALARRWEGEPGYDPALARDWIEAGAVYVGGCCRVGPQTIAGLADSGSAA
jgi:homocysteine S-methyltransferase